MKFKATQDQVLLICINMINACEVAIAARHFQGATEASTVVDYKGMLEWVMMRPGDLGYDFDYFNGRMVKTSIKRTGPYYPGIEEWEIDVELPNPEYQSWGRVFPTVQALLDSTRVMAY